MLLEIEKQQISLGMIQRDLITDLVDDREYSNFASELSEDQLPATRVFEPQFGHAHFCSFARWRQLFCALAFFLRRSAHTGQSRFTERVGSTVTCPAPPDTSWPGPIAATG
jgi:hypothetical protein